MGLWFAMVWGPDLLMVSFFLFLGGPFLPDAGSTVMSVVVSVGVGVDVLVLCVCVIGIELFIFIVIAIHTL